MIFYHSFKRRTLPLPYSWYIGVWLVKLVGWLSCYIPPSSQGPWNFKSFNVVRLQFQTSGDQSSHMKNPYDLNDGWFPPWLSEKLKPAESANGRSVNIVSTCLTEVGNMLVVFVIIVAVFGCVMLCDGCSSSRRRLLSPILEGELVNLSLFQVSELKGLASRQCFGHMPCYIHVDCQGLWVLDSWASENATFKPTNVGRLWPWELVERLWLHERTDKSYQVKSNIHYL